MQKKHSFPLTIKQYHSHKYVPQGTKSIPKWDWRGKSGNSYTMFNSKK